MQYMSRPDGMLNKLKSSMIFGDFIDLCFNFVFNFILFFFRSEWFVSAGHSHRQTVGGSNHMIVSSGSLKDVQNF